MLIVGVWVLVSVNSTMKFVVRVNVQVLDVYLIAIVKHENICVDPRVVSVSV